MAHIETTPQDDASPVIVLLLQGGGALGAYQVGAYQALAEAGYLPDWVAGISIGAISAALIVGNSPADRVDKLDAFFHEVSRPDGWGALLSGDLLRLFHLGSFTQALLFGQPHFFTPRVINPAFAPAGTPAAMSFYDTTPLRATLERLVDFDRINAQPVRLSLGVTHVTSGTLLFFDNTSPAHRRLPSSFIATRLGPEHILASGALPPSFAATRIDGELYWDGGCVSNTPLQAVVDDEPAGRVLVFAIDLWAPRGPEPQTIDAVLWRQKQIQYASRTTNHIEAVARQQNLRAALGHLAAQLPSATRAGLAGLPAHALEYHTQMDIVHLVYHPSPEEIAQSDAEFSRPSLAARRAAGYAEMRQVLEQAPWRPAERAARVGPQAGTVVHRVEGGQISSRAPIG